MFNLKIKMYETHGNIGRGTKGKISMSRFHSIIPGPHMHGLAIESIEESQGGPPELLGLPIIAERVSGI